MIWLLSNIIMMSCTSLQITSGGADSAEHINFNIIGTTKELIMTSFYCGGPREDLGMRSRRKCQKLRNRQNLPRLRTFPQFAVSRCPRSTISQRIVTSTLVANKMWTLQAYLASSSYTGTVVGPSWREELRVTILSTPDSRRGPRSLSAILLSFSLGNVPSLSDP